MNHSIVPDFQEVINDNTEGRSIMMIIAPTLFNQVTNRAWPIGGDRFPGVSTADDSYMLK